MPKKMLKKSPSSRSSPTGREGSHSGAHDNDANSGSFSRGEKARRRVFQRSSKPVSVRSGQVEFLKLNLQRREYRDIYQWLLSLKWPEFAVFIAGIYIVLNLIFAEVYALGDGCIAGLRPGSYFDAFFFSVQTLATVGYGHWYPQTVYGHIVTTIEIIVGVFGLAVMTGLIFVRFSRPAARILFSKVIVIGSLNGRPTLMLRVGNLRAQSMVEAEFRILFTRDEPIVEGDPFRYFYNLKLHFDRLISFPAALTLRHTIDEQSPLYGETAESLAKSRAMFVASVVGIDPVIPAAVQTQQDYTWRDIRFGERFVEIYSEPSAGKLSVDFGRLHDTEPVTQTDSRPV
jgi:inward rectifier potassium channel